MNEEEECDGEEEPIHEVFLPWLEDSLLMVRAPSSYLTKLVILHRDSLSLQF